MRILLDEAVPRRFGRDLPGHETSTVQGLGWAGKKNGEILHLASGDFDVLVTVDKKMRFEQNLVPSMGWGAAPGFRASRNFYRSARVGRV